MKRTNIAHENVKQNYKAAKLLSFLIETSHALAYLQLSANSWVFFLCEIPASS